MFAQSISMSSSALMSNYMNALSAGSSEPSASATPDSHPSFFDDSLNFPNVSALILPTSIEGDLSIDAPLPSNATVVSSAFSSLSPSLSSIGAAQENSPPPMIITTGSKSNKSGGNSNKSNRKSASNIERLNSLPSPLLIPHSPHGEAVTHPVPEFLCHLFSMLRDPALSSMISWAVPCDDEPDHLGGGMRGIGKIVVHKPDALQEHVLGKYYRHSKYASFQRQLNYFGFKKRLHGGKKGKLSPCSYVHEKLGAETHSLFQLKRRPPVKKRASIDSAVSVSSAEEAAAAPVRSAKKARTGEAKKAPTEKKIKNEPQEMIVTHAVPMQVHAEEYAPPSTDLQPQGQLQYSQLSSASAAATFAVGSCSLPRPSYMPAHQIIAPSNAINQNATVAAAPQRIITNRPASVMCDTMLQELLSTTLPPSDVLFDDDLIEGMSNGNNVPDGFWVTDDGRCMSHNSLVDLAMFY